MDVSVVIPVYNGANTINDLHEKIVSELTGHFSFEVIFVFDYGKDNSWEIIKEVAENDPEHVRGFYLDRNYGQHCATAVGLKKSKGEYIFTLDEDVQHDPKYIKSMIKKMEDEKLDLLYGRFNRLEQPFVRVWMSFFLRRVLCVMISDLPWDYSAYRLIRNKLARGIVENDAPGFFLDAELGTLSLNHGSLLIDHFKRSNGSTSYTIIRLVRQTINVLYRYSKVFKLLFNSVLFVSVILIAYSFYLLALNPTIHLFVFAALLLNFSAFLTQEKVRWWRQTRKNKPRVFEHFTEKKNDNWE